MNLRRASLLIVSLFLLVVVTGCPRKNTVASGKTGPKVASAEDLLKSAIHQLRPENFSIAAAPDKPVSLLNSWRGMLADAKLDAETIESASPTPPSNWTSPELEKRLKNDKFDEQDAIHIRDCLLSNAIATYLAARSNDELQRIQEVVQFVVRNVALRGDDEPELPISTYLILMTGRGSAEDRAWVASLILKQLRIDSVIVRPAEAAKADTSAWLFGVILNDHIHLFDFKLGLAIPSGTNQDAIASAPATLNEIADHPEWLQQLTARADQPYQLDAESLKSPVVMPISEPDFWGRRMNRLEQVLPAETACILFDPVVDDLGRTGLLKRIHAAWPDQKSENVGLWPYPSQQLMAARMANQATMQQVQQLLIGFSAPISVKTDPQTGASGQPVAERKMLKIRTDQLLGKFEDVTQRYLSIRHLEIETAKILEAVQLHRMAAEDAIYWSGLSKFESGEFEAAVEQLSGYVKRFDRKGRWTFAARSLLAECRVRQGRYADAVAAIERTASEDPYREANSIRIKRWQPLAKKIAQPDEKK
jgi:hypothetical protein